MATAHQLTVVPTDVAPNEKCNGCLHYASNQGTVGVCVVGSKPWLCGDGDDQLTGYSPMAAQRPTEPGDAADTARAPEVQDVVRTVPMSLVVLGEEHADMVKSIHDDLKKIQRSLCPLHQSEGITRSYGQHAGIQVCRCERIPSKELAQKLFRSLENSVRVHLNESDVLYFVRGVRKGLTAYEISLGRLRANAVTGAQLAKSLHDGDEEPRGKGLGDNNALAKSLYGEDWTTQFLGTDLFDEASKLREHEIKMCEDDLKRTIERRKKEREAAKLRIKNETEESPWWQQDEDNQRFRIAKEKLMLKLQRHRQAQIKASRKEMSKGADGDVLKTKANRATNIANSTDSVQSHQKAIAAHAAAVDHYRSVGDTANVAVHQKHMNYHRQQITGTKG